MTSTYNYMTAPNTLFGGEPYGFYDSMTYDVDQQSWLDSYNDSTAYTYFDPNNYSNPIDFPGFFLGSDDSSNYRPATMNTSNISVTLSLFRFDLISTQCYNNVFAANSRTDILGLAYSNKAYFMTESVGILISWALVSSSCCRCFWLAWS